MTWREPGWLARLSRARRGGDQGAEVVEVAVTMPVVILVVMVALQAGLYFHGRSVAQAAAQEGCRVAGAAFDGTVEAGHTAAQRFADQMGAGELVDARVQASRSDDMVQVTVSGTGMSLVPGWRPTIKRTSTCPVERVTQ